MTELDQAQRLARLQQRRSTTTDPMTPLPAARRRARSAPASTRIATTSMAAAAMFGLVSAMALAATNDDQDSEPLATYVVPTAATTRSFPSGEALPAAVRDTRVPVVRLSPVHSASVRAQNRSAAAAPPPAPARRAATNASR